MGDPQARRRRLSPYQRIMRAAEAGRGVRLSADDVFAMSGDNAIQQVAWRQDNPAEAAEDDAADKRVRSRGWFRVEISPDLVAMHEEDAAKKAAKGTK